MNRELAQRIAVPAGALLCLLLAVVLALLALDVAASSDAIRTGDVRYRVSPEDGGLWRADELVPLDLARNVLGVEDDVAFRRAVRGALRLARLEDSSASTSDPEVAISRNEAQIRLEAFVQRHRPCPTLACRRSPRCARAREIRHGDRRARGAPVEHGREPPSRDCARSFERRGETQPRARVSARTRLPVD